MGVCKLGKSRRWEGACRAGLCALLWAWSAQGSALAQLLGCVGHVDRAVRYEKVEDTAVTIGMRYVERWGNAPRFTRYYSARTRTFYAKDYVTEVVTFSRERGWPEDVRQQVIAKGPILNDHRHMKFFEAMFAQANENYAAFLPSIRETCDFAKEHDTLRNHWPEGFTDGLFEMAEKHLPNSSIVRTRFRDSRKLFGTIRLVSSYYERRIPVHVHNPNPSQPILVDDIEKYLVLDESRAMTGTLRNSLWTYFNPEWARWHDGWMQNSGFVYPLVLEDHLGVKIDRNVLWLPYAPDYMGIPHNKIGVGAVHEAGLWAMSRDMNAIGFSELLIHLLNLVIETQANIPMSFNFDGKMLYAYCDEKGEQHFRRMGFERTEHDIIPKTYRDGAGSKTIHWRVVRLTIPKLLALLVNLEKVRNNIPGREADSLRETLEALLTHYQQFTLSHTGIRF